MKSTGYGSPGRNLFHFATILSGTSSAKLRETICNLNNQNFIAERLNITCPRKTKGADVINNNSSYIRWFQRLLSYRYRTIIIGELITQEGKMTGG
jgi:hypothetical protein